jgi:hypothetical protein
MAFPEASAFCSGGHRCRHLIASLPVAFLLCHITGVAEVRPAAVRRDRDCAGDLMGMAGALFNCKTSRIGEIGPTTILHFEIRPVAPGTTQTDAAWQARYSNDPSMNWSRYDPVDPKKFDADVFGGRKRKP